MNNVFVYIELENGVPADVSLELLTKGRELATTLGVKLEAVVLGHNLGDIAQELAKYGADTVWTADDKEFAPFRTLPHTVRSDRAGEAPDRPFRCDFHRPRFRSARIVGAVQWSDGRLYATGDRRP